MIRVWVNAASAIGKAGLESIVRSEDGFEIAPSVADADVALIEGEIDSEDPGLPRVVLLEPGQRAAAALRGGASAALPHNANAREIVAAVAAAAAGLVAMTRETYLSLPQEPVAEADVPLVDLTPREVEVLRLMAEGAANKTIAWKLGITENTAKFHVAQILSKLDAGSRAEAVAIGMRRGLVLL